MNSLTLTAGQAERFGLVKKPKKDSYDLTILEILIEEETETTLVLSFEGTERKIVFNHVLDPQEDIRLLVAWCCLEYFDFDFEKNGTRLRINRAKELMGRISDSINRGSCLPAYIFYRYNLEDRGNDGLYLRQFRYASDTFPDFYRLIWQRDRNKIRASAILKEGLQKFPSDIRIVSDLASYYFHRRKYGECLEVLSGIAPESKHPNWGYAVGCISLKYQVLIELGRYTEAKEVTDSWALKPAFKAFFYGLIAYREGIFEEASKHFRVCMEACPEDELVEASGYFLIGCYLRMKEYEEALATFKYLPLSESTDFVLPYFEFTFADQAEQVTRGMLVKVDEELASAMLSGRLAYIMRHRHLRHDDEDRERKMLKSESDALKEALESVRKAIKVHPRSSLFHSEYSELLSLKRKYDEAKKHAVIACMLEKASAHYQSLDKCSPRFVENYASLIKDLVEKQSFSFEGYASSFLEHDINDLYELREYRQIAELVDLFEQQGLEADKERHLDTALFLIAYSYNKCGNVEQGKKYYKFLSSIGRESTGSLNNLALIYEKEGDMVNANKFIQQAKQKLGGQKDDMIEKNYERIVGDAPKRSNKVENPMPPPAQSPPSFDPKEGDVVINETRVHITTPGTYQYNICQMIFSQKNVGDWVKDQDIENRFSYGERSESDRRVQDAVRNINKKIKAKANVDHFFQHTGARVRLDPRLLV